MQTQVEAHRAVRWETITINKDGEEIMVLFPICPDVQQSQA